MAKQTRLGRDPLAGVAKAPADKPSKPAPRAKAAAKAGPKKAGPAARTKKPADAAAKSVATKRQGIPEEAIEAKTAQDAVTSSPKEIAAAEVAAPAGVPAALPAATPETNPLLEPIAAIEPIPRSMPAGDVAPSAAAEPTAFAPVAGLLEDAPLSAIEPLPRSVSADTQTPAGEASARDESAAPEAVAPSQGTPDLARPVATPTDPVRTAAIPEATTANALAVGEVHAVVAATSPPPADGPHPAEVFLRGVLEGLALAGSLDIRVDVDPATFALPVEKLFYFSHALQLLAAPLECPTASWRKPGDGAGPVATLTVKLSPLAADRHRLRIYDNGLFFRNYLPEIGLDREALRPLLLFVVKRGGSICLKQGRYVEFEIIG
jgi:hypothetical protein